VSLTLTETHELHVARKRIEDLGEEPLARLLMSLLDAVDLRRRPNETVLEALERLAYKGAMDRFSTQKRAGEFLGVSNRVMCYQVKRLGLRKGLYSEIQEEQRRRRRIQAEHRAAR
jgi:hypothetical protein